VTSRQPYDDEEVEDDVRERVALRNRSSTRRHHPNPSPSPASSSTSLQRVDHSQMNHVGPPQPSRRAGRASVTPPGSTLSAEDVGYNQQRHPGDRRSLQPSVDGSGADNVSWNEVDGERLMDAPPPPAHDGTPAAEQPAPEPSEVTEEHHRLTARPSLKIRRRFDCPDLVIIKRNPSAEEVSAACTARADPAPAPPPTQRRLPPSFSSPSSSAASSGSTFVSRLPRRRLTMPGIIKYDPADLARRRPGSARSSSRTPAEPLPAEYIPAATAADTVAVDSLSATPPSSDVPPVDAGFGVRGGRPAAEMYLVENCARKRLQEEQMSQDKVAAAADDQQTIDIASILDTPSLDGLDPPKPLAMRYRQVLFCKRTH